MSKTLKKFDYRVKAMTGVKKNLLNLDKRNVPLEAAEKA